MPKITSAQFCSLRNSFNNLSILLKTRRLQPACRYNRPLLDTCFTIQNDGPCVYWRPALGSRSRSNGNGGISRQPREWDSPMLRIGEKYYHNHHLLLASPLVVPCTLQNRLEQYRQCLPENTIKYYKIYYWFLIEWIEPFNSRKFNREYGLIIFWFNAHMQGWIHVYTFYTLKNYITFYYQTSYVWKTAGIIMQYMFIQINIKSITQSIRFIGNRDIDTLDIKIVFTAIQKMNSKYYQLSTVDCLCLVIVMVFTGLCYFHVHKREW